MLGLILSSSNHVIKPKEMDDGAVRYNPVSPYGTKLQETMKEKKTHQKTPQKKNKVSTLSTIPIYYYTPN